MGRMKHLPCALAALALALSCILPAGKVSAAVTSPAASSRPLAAETSTRYAVAADGNVWFYSRADENSRLFRIPYTYYVRVTAEGEPYAAVEYSEDMGQYRKLSGYCRTDALTFVDFIPERPFLFKEITLLYTLPQADALGGGKFSETERTFVYYGSRDEDGKLYYYVGADGEFDYVPAEGELSYDLNTDYLPSPSAEETESGLSPAGIAAICIACAAAVAVAVFVLRGKRPHPEAERADF